MLLLSHASCNNARRTPNALVHHNMLTAATAVAQGFPHHRDIVTGLAFRDDTHVLYSGSFDRTVKIWSLDDRSYVDTLYGHQSEVSCTLRLLLALCKPLPADSVAIFATCMEGWLPR